MLALRCTELGAYARNMSLLILLRRTLALVVDLRPQLSTVDSLEPIDNSASAVRVLLREGTLGWIKEAIMHLYWSIGCLLTSSAIALAAYGSHAQSFTSESRDLWMKATQYLALPAIALMIVGRWHRPPHIPAAMLLTGAGLFCLPLFYFAKTEDRAYNYLMPKGGSLMILGFAVLAFY
jgi:uncharacterized membrane protein YgdD (TMEM256/DUF423 family)